VKSWSDRFAEPLRHHGILFPFPACSVTGVGSVLLGFDSVSHACLLFVSFFSFLFFLQLGLSLPWFNAEICSDWCSNWSVPHPSAGPSRLFVAQFEPSSS
jgi:hypothetical protein